MGDPIDKSLVMRRIARLPRVLAAAPSLLEQYGAPETPEDLVRLPWLGVLQPHFDLRKRLVIGSGEEAREIPVRPVLLLDTVTALREVAVAGAGFTLLPAWIAERDLAVGSLVRLLPTWSIPDIDLLVGYSTGRHTSGRLRAFFDFAQEEIPRLLAEP